MSSKKSKTSAECSVSMQYTAQPPAVVSDAAAKLSDSPEDLVACSCAGHTAVPKENRSPNLTLLDHLEAELDTYSDLRQVLAAALRHSSYSKQCASCAQDMLSVNLHSLLPMLLQATSGQETSAAPTDSSEGLLNLLLLADSSLQDCDDPSIDMPNQPEAMSEQMTDDAMHRGTEDNVTASMSLHTAENQPNTSQASQQRPMSAGTLTSSFLRGCKKPTTCCCQHFGPLSPCM